MGNGYDRRTTDKIILQELQNLKTSFEKFTKEFGELKTEVVLVKQRQVNFEKENTEYINKFREVLKILSSHKFQRLMVDANRIADQEKVLEIMSDEYEGIEGFKLWPKVGRYMANMFNEKKVLEENFLKKFADGFYKFSIKTLPIILVTSLTVISIVIIILTRFISFDQIIELVKIISVK